LLGISPSPTFRTARHTEKIFDGERAARSRKSAHPRPLIHRNASGSIDKLHH
jgi:hypothetical protein